MINDHFEHQPSGKPWSAFWLMTVPWAHPLWSQYFVSIVDLTTPAGKPPSLARPGMTHEVMVWALNPERPIAQLDRAKWPAVLTPANHAYQFKAASNEEARQRVAGYLSEIENKRLSPDTDFTPMWDALFADGVSLKISGFALLAATVQ